MEKGHNMNSIIANGCTKIKMNPHDKNADAKYGAFGISRFKASYKIEIEYKNKRYYLGLRKDLEDAKALRFEAEAKIAEGTFIEWFQELKKKSKK